MSSPTTTVYWRPGCPYCTALLHRLDKAGLQYEKRNIWEDEEAAAFVRSVARGNETVPTVTVGDQWFVNPGTRRVLEAVAASSPQDLPADYEPPRPGLLTRLLGT